MDQNGAKELLDKYINGACTATEKRLVETWFLEELELAKADFPDLDYEVKEKQIYARLPQAKPKASPVLWPGIAAAAAILLVIGFGIQFLDNKKERNSTQSSYAHDFSPGGNKAILTLASGKQIVLDDVKNGRLADESNSVIRKTKEGQIVYDLREAAHSPADSLAFNTIATPRGGQYQVILPDGSHVWLNAASSIKFPVSFLGKTRNVELRGEAYFEVAKNKEKPFKVFSGTQVVEVLGTHFNMNTYTDEPVNKTTLLEGLIRINQGKSAGLLQPGEQAQISAQRPLRIVAADTEEAVAWKNGIFSFKRADIPTVMRQLSRWYDFELKYENGYPDVHFTGEIDRKIKASQALDMLNYLNIRFEIKGKQVIVKN
ncbi:FecR family protein [Pedobacter sp. AW31-3R]|uniref:FecR family protein n=1 Tax=Pedobacter sp. AW31-3R TaxID=3445781 RepID=UPI003FA107EB